MNRILLLALLPITVFANAAVEGVVSTTSILPIMVAKAVTSLLVFYLITINLTKDELSTPNKNGRYIGGILAALYILIIPTQNKSNIDIYLGGAIISFVWFLVGFAVGFFWKKIKPSVETNAPQESVKSEKLKYNKKYVLIIAAIISMVALYFYIEANTNYLEDGKVAYEKKDYALALKNYKKAAERNEAEAQYRIGVMYFLAEGVKEDNEAAASWFKLAASQGHVDAQIELAGMYVRGDWVKQDYVEAARLFKLAAAQGSDIAQIRLAHMYELGKGVKQDYVEAMRLFKLAVAQGSDDAKRWLADMYEDGKGVKQDYVEAVRWYKLAAEQGNMDAIFKLAEAYKDGRGVVKNNTEAIRLYTQAAEKGDTTSQMHLFKIYEYGIGVAKDSAKAAHMNKLLAETMRYYKFMLALRYENGNGVVQDYAEAVRWYRLAAAEGDEDAQNNLGVKYYYGMGVPQDYVRAHMWYNLAAAKGSKLASKNRGLLVAKMTSLQIAEAQKLARECQSNNYKNCD